MQRHQNLADLENAVKARANLGVYSKDEVDQKAPCGMIGYFPFDKAPTGWLKANGAAVSRTAYAELFSKLGEKWGKGDGFNTFNLPDLRGEFIRGLDDGRGIDVDRTIGSNQGDQLRSHTHGASADTQGGHTHTGTTNTQGNHSHNGSTNADGDHAHGGSTSTDGGHQHDSGWGESSGAPYGFARTNAQGSGDTDWDNRSFLTNTAGSHSHTIETDTRGTHSHTIETDARGAHSHTLQLDSAGAHSHKITVSASGGNETRPRNVALLVCIKY